MIITMDLVLTGARAGKTVKLNGKQFVQGVLRLRGSHEQLEPVKRYFGLSYAAHPAGSEELKAAQERDAAEAAKRNGVDQAHKAGQPGPTNGVERTGSDAGAGGNQTSAPAVQHSTGDGAKTGSEGLRPSGDGHTDSGLRAGQVPQQQQSNAQHDLTRIRDAVLGLDPDVVENWTPDGKPTVEAVAQVTSDPSITRKQIDAAAADWNRDVALEKKRKG